MEHEFAILPWEYRGSGFDPAPHAQHCLEVKGHKRQFLLKVHEGILYFQEPKRAPVYALTRQFHDLPQSDEVIPLFETEFNKGNYGRFIARYLSVPRVTATTLVTIIHRADGAGQIREWFDDEWHEIPSYRNKQLKIWGAQSFHVANRRAIRRLRPHMLNRVMPEEERRGIPRRWIAGSENEVRAIMPHVLRLFAPHIGDHYWASEQIPLELWSCCPGSNGYFNQYSPTGGYFYAYGFSPLLRQVLELVKKYAAFEEFTWFNYRDTPPSQPFFYLNQSEIDGGNERYGHDWRGNYYCSPGKIRFDIETFSPPTAHEKLESLLVFRDWLEGKVTPQQSARLLKRAQE